MGSAAVTNTIGTECVACSNGPTEELLAKITSGPRAAKACAFLRRRSAALHRSHVFGAVRLTVTSEVGSRDFFGAGRGGAARGRGPIEDSMSEKEAPFGYLEERLAVVEGLDQVQARHPTVDDEAAVRKELSRRPIHHWRLQSTPS